MGITTHNMQSAMQASMRSYAIVRHIRPFCAGVTNPRVFFDMTVGGNDAGRIEIEVCSVPVGASSDCVCGSFAQMSHQGLLRTFGPSVPARRALARAASLCTTKVQSSIA